MVMIQNDAHTSAPEDMNVTLVPVPMFIARQWNHDIVNEFGRLCFLCHYSGRVCMEQSNIF